MKKLVALTLIVAGCAAHEREVNPPMRAAANTQADVAAIRRNIELAVAAHAASDADAWTNLFEPNGVLMPEGAPAVQGRAAIRNWIAAFYQMNRFTTSIDLQEIQVVGDWAFSRDNFTGTLTPRHGGASMRMVGKEIVIWRRQPDGSWKASRAIFNSNQPPGGS